MQRTTIFLCLAFVATGCAGTIESTVRDAREARRIPAGVVVTYDDRSTLLGGDRIEVATDGTLRWWSDPPTSASLGGSPEDSFDDARTLPDAPAREPDRVATIEPARLQRLLELLVAIEPWDDSPDSEADSLLERRRAFLRVQRGNDRITSWQWADPTESGDDRITSIRRWAETAVPPRVVTPEPRPEPAEEPDDGPNPVLRNR